MKSVEVQVLDTISYNLQMLKSVKKCRQVSGHTIDPTKMMNMGIFASS